MIKSITVTNYLGDSLKLELGRPEESGFLIVSITGLGPSKGTINTTEVSTNDGSLYNSARLNQRNIVMDLLFTETVKGETIEDIRQKSYKYFPMKGRLELLIETDNRLVSTNGYVESNEPNIFAEREGTQISIICPDPYFYSAGEDGVVTTTFYGLVSIFEFPFSNESVTEPLIVFGEIQDKTENVIPYYGNAEIGVTIKIHALGEVGNITMYNTRTRETMRIVVDRLVELTGSGIIEGDDIIIDTNRGNKSIILIRDGNTTNILNCLDKNTDWIHLANGDNIFAFTAESGISNMQLLVENRVIYEGV